MSRLIGTTTVDDHVNSWFDHATETFSAHNTYEQQTLANGTLDCTRRDKVAATVTCQGYWFDSAGHTFRRYFKDSLLTMASTGPVAIDLGDDLVYAAADVLSVDEQCMGIIGNASGVLLKAWRWSIKIQCLSGTRS